MKIVKPLSLLTALLFSSCNFETLFEPSFNEPVKEFFETYTNTAAIEEHQLSVESYRDSSSRLCISSDEECTVELYLRNPQMYTLTPSLAFSSLEDEGIDISEVTISQTDKSTITLVLPQSFLADCDEGKNISPTISLLEPMSGRTFADYSFSLYSNTKPPLLNNATILNNNNETFVIAFDMPSQAELALRHKDLSQIIVNGNAFPLEISQDGSFTFTDEAFSTTEKKYTEIGSKSFSYSDRSVYFSTSDPFTNGTKEYSIILSDAAGLTTETIASTEISKLNTPSVTNPAGKAVESSYNSETKEYMPRTLPKLSGKEYSEVTITAPDQDNKGNKVAAEGLEVHYALYKGTPKVARLEKSGTFSGEEKVQLTVGSWYLETYATKTNYEKSSVTKRYIRVVDSYIFVGGEGASDNDDESDGTDATPYASIGKAISDINKRNDDSVEYTLVIGGEITGETNTATIAAAGLVITGATSVTSDKINDLSLTSEIPVKFTEITVGHLTAGSANNFTLTENAVVETATVQSGATIYIEGNAKISEAILEESGTLTITGDLTNDKAVTLTPASYTNGAKVLADSDYLADNYAKIAVTKEPNNDDTEWSIKADGTLIETAKRNISISVITQESDIKVSKTVSGSILTFTLEEGQITGCTLDGNSLIPAGDSLVSIDTSSWLKGIYDLYIEAAKDGETYSYHAQIEIK
ncbi:hypothetical protein MSI_03320 [Treponema sp. JC4]|uniref:hypothetical protein n=1 Tax=Treponema sp. JC4 TaxID=1124982 RepID=UPI00025B09E5|nr:hypothetical protein [Treponema sp. JC4]EID85904.1 hypothetical protein MSI_03320 [Treponema sp. JC4]